MSEQLRMIALILSLIGIVVWVLAVIHRPKLRPYSLVVFFYLISVAARYISMIIIGYEVAVVKYQLIYNTWTTATTLYLVLAIALTGAILWKD
jgi:hypothetical protein